MANLIYTKAREAFLSAGISLPGDDIRVVLIDTGGYTVNGATHQFLSDIPTPARVATSGALTGKSVTDGVFDAADVTFSALGGASVEAIILYKHTGTASTSRLIAYIDTSAGSGITFVPNGGDLTLRWSDGANKIFRLLQ
ncbi:hypothetical protein RCF27_09425 [Rhodococcus pyridinivorans]|uniref:hypothetical protein n=1 Tax=Rhodococcus pyridinivorans TaxID=103816 RepID=UPI00280BC286|nr:hypothetical protein [Rhodococcus pyridinivorans]WMM74478.1 hypothetical protein RCF27_09425 [Rhodococcus pyridinivorans]